MLYFLICVIQSGPMMPAPIDPTGVNESPLTGEQMLIVGAIVIIFAILILFQLGRENMRAVWQDLRDLYWPFKKRSDRAK